MHSPMKKFHDWFSNAKRHPAIVDATATTLATATPEGKPSARVVLLKDADEAGFVFYGNMESRKFQELAKNPHAALCFYWAPLNQQVRIEGAVVPVSDAEADAYFATRERGKQIGAWASFQSQPLENRELLSERLAQFNAVYEGLSVPRPPHWSGWRLSPMRMEFWSQGEFRLHEREVFIREDAVAPWKQGFLYP